MTPGATDTKDRQHSDYEVYRRRNWTQKLVEIPGIKTKPALPILNKNIKKSKSEVVIGNKKERTTKRADLSPRPASGKRGKRLDVSPQKSDRKPKNEDSNPLPTSDKKAKKGDLSSQQKSDKKPKTADPSTHRALDKKGKNTEQVSVRRDKPQMNHDPDVKGKIQVNNASKNMNPAGNKARCDVKSNPRSQTHTKHNRDDNGMIDSAKSKSQKVICINTIKHWCSIVGSDKDDRENSGSSKQTLEDANNKRTILKRLMRRQLWQLSKNLIRGSEEWSKRMKENGIDINHINIDAVDLSLIDIDALGIENKLMKSTITWLLK